MTYVMDTHALVWFLEGNSRLSIVAQNALVDRTAQVVVPTIVLAEITFLYTRHRIAIDLPHVLAHLTSAANCLVYPLDGPVVERLPTILNIHDAIIVSTALVFRDVLSERTAVVTKDADITASGLVNVVW
jgi:PIN domain nuclease of toxin-antitoxin system